MGLFNRKANNADLQRGATPLYVGAGQRQSSYSLYLQSHQLIERALAFVKFDNKNPNPFESMNEFIVHLIDAYTNINGVTIVKNSNGYYYVSDALTQVGADLYQFTSNVTFGTPKAMVGQVSGMNVMTVRSATLSAMLRVTPEANSLLGNAIQTVIRRLKNLGMMNLIWQKKGFQDLKVTQGKNQNDAEILQSMTQSNGGVLQAGTDDKFTQLQPDYSKADGTEIVGAIALYSYVTGLSPEYLRGAQSDQQLVQTVLELLKPFLTTLSEKNSYFSNQFDFSQLATLQQSQAKGDSTKLTPQMAQGGKP